MKKLLLYIVFVSYAIVMVKPALPYMSDFIGHIIFYKQHMATVHFENGKYHVHKEVVKDIKEENSNKNSLPEKKKSSTQYEYVAIVNKQSSQTTDLLSTAYSIYLKQSNSSPYIAYNYPPPRV